MVSIWFLNETFVYLVMEEKEELVVVRYRDSEATKSRIFDRAKKKKMSVTCLISVVMEEYLDSQDRIDTPKKRF